MFTKLFKDFLHAVVPPAIVFGLFTLRVYVLPSHNELDVAADFLGGGSIAWMAMILWLRWTGHGWIPKQIPAWLCDFTIMGTVALVGVGWEFMEFVVGAHFHIMLQDGLADTMGDLFMDLLGGFLFIVSYRLVNMFPVGRPAVGGTPR